MNNHQIAIASIALAPLAALAQPGGADIPIVKEAFKHNAAVPQTAPINVRDYHHRRWQIQLHDASIQRQYVVIDGK
jgi:hypothetical protein